MSVRMSGGYERLAWEFHHPAEEFSPIPFWFWNDTLTEEELSRQIRAFKEKGVDGFVIHPRLGLDPAIPYMGERWLSLVRYAVELARELNMKVILYDEAMYPSGSCCGQVVAEDPSFCAKGLRMSASPVISEGETLVAQADRKGGTVYFVMTPTKGTIRGAYFGQDDGQPDAPPAADLLDPRAVAAFIRLTHEKYYAALSEHFGETVIAIFTDEPSLQGRGGIGGLIPWTGDFWEELTALGYTADQLPALFDKDHEDHAAIREGYDQAVYRRMNDCYYGQIAAWCRAHGIDLAGHPAESDDIHLLSHFGIPCQDIVWRYLAPDEPTNVIGRHSTMGKCASDSARHRGKRRNGNECFGVCGHKDDPYAFDRADMKWYVDWLFARGCNLIIPHAFYYSLRGPRKDERPPEVGMHSSFWGEYRELSDYIKRCCAINTDSVNITDVAILCRERHLPDLPARPLYEGQIEFNYLERSLLGNTVLTDGTARIASQAYRVIITDGHTDGDTAAFLAAFREAGGIVLDYASYDGDETAYLADVRRASHTWTRMDTHPKDLRLTRVRKYGVEILFLTNEGEETVSATVQEPVAEIWDSEAGTRRTHDGGSLTVTLAPRQSLPLIMGGKDAPTS